MKSSTLWSTTAPLAVQINLTLTTITRQQLPLSHKKQCQLYQQPKLRKTHPRIRQCQGQAVKQLSLLLQPILIQSPSSSRSSQKNQCHLKTSTVGPLQFTRNKNLITVPNALSSWSQPTQESTTRDKMSFTLSSNKCWKEGAAMAQLSQSRCCQLPKRTAMQGPHRL